MLLAKVRKTTKNIKCITLSASETTTNYLNYAKKVFYNVSFTALC